MVCLSAKVETIFVDRRFREKREKLNRTKYTKYNQRPTRSLYLFNNNKLEALVIKLNVTKKENDNYLSGHERMCCVLIFICSFRRHFSSGKECMLKYI